MATDLYAARLSTDQVLPNIGVGFHLQFDTEIGTVAQVSTGAFQANGEFEILASGLYAVQMTVRARGTSTNFEIELQTLGGVPLTDRTGTRVIWFSDDNNPTDKTPAAFQCSVFEFTVGDQFKAEIIGGAPTFIYSDGTVFNMSRVPA